MALKKWNSKQAYNYWSFEEMRLLSEGKVPPGRTMAQCRHKARAIGLDGNPFCPNGSEVVRSQPTEEELECIRNGQIPKGWNESRTRYIAYKHKIGFHPFRDKQIDQLLEKRDQINQLREQHVPVNEIAKRFNISRQRMYQILAKCKEYDAARNATQAESTVNQ